MPRKALKLPEVIDLLKKHHGAPAWPPTRDAFELVLLENVAYLARPARRRKAFELLKETVGTEPSQVLAASQDTLEAVTGTGILADTFAAKLKTCAGIVLDTFGGDLDHALSGTLADAKRALRRFPGIGEPGAEKILLLSGRHALLAPESNALRVLERIGFVRDQGSYARTYAAARDLAKQLPPKTRAVQEAHLLLQQHGQTLCKRTSPLCEECPVAGACAHAASTSPRGKS